VAGLLEDVELLRCIRGLMRDPRRNTSLFGPARDDKAVETRMEH
jgi:hypothetical protein